MENLLYTMPAIIFMIGSLQPRDSGRIAVRMPPWPLTNHCVTMWKIASSLGLHCHEYKNEAKRHMVSFTNLSFLLTSPPNNQNSFTFIYIIYCSSESSYIWRTFWCLKKKSLKKAHTRWSLTFSQYSSLLCCNLHGEGYISHSKIRLLTVWKKCF